MSRGKFSDEDGKKSDDLLNRVQEFCMSNYFEEEFEAFAKQHAHIFLRSLDMKEDEEQPLEFHDVYLKYLSKFECLIEDFISAVLQV